MTKFNIKKKFLSKQLVIGTWLQTGSATVAEIMAQCGFDFIAADMEHTDISDEIFFHFARAIDGKSAPFARVKSNDVMAIRRVLDGGANGVIVPLVNNAKQAEFAVASAKYPPLGVRGYAYVRANNWGIDFDEYIKKANDEVAVIVMIETVEAVENIYEILAVEGVDAVFIGPYDLSGSYGVTGQIENELVVEGMDKVLKACKEKNVVAGQHIVVPTEKNIKLAIEQGYTLLALGIDTVFVARGAKYCMDIVLDKD